MGRTVILHGDCLEKLREMPDNSVDAVVTDPPYGLSAAKNSGKKSKGGFMGKLWDYDVPSVDVWRECLRVLKPGGHALIACGTRTQHRMALNIEDAGFEIRDVITWLYGSGFPKSHDISKALDKAAGAEREVVSKKPSAYKVKGLSTDNSNDGYKRPSHDNWEKDENGYRMDVITAPSTDAAKQWSGWGTALKPAVEFWTLARKPLEGTVAANVTKWGVGGINVDGCRVSIDDLSQTQRSQTQRSQTQRSQTQQSGHTVTLNVVGHSQDMYSSKGRFPANLILDEEAARLLDEQSGTLKSGAFQQKGLSANSEQPGGWKTGNRNAAEWGATSGGASRFFYVAKASKAERNAGCEGLPEKLGTAEAYTGLSDPRMDREQLRRPNANHHPTVKPIKLMRYLCRLITPPGGIVLDPFMGSGSTGVAAKQEGFRFIGIEREAEYVEIAKARSA